MRAAPRSRSCSSTTRRRAGGLMTTHLVTVPDTATVARRSTRSGGRPRRWRTSTRSSWWMRGRRLVGVLSFRALAVSPACAPGAGDHGRRRVVTRRARRRTRRRSRGSWRATTCRACPWWTIDGRLLGCVTFDDVIRRGRGRDHRGHPQVRRRLGRRGAEAATGRRRSGAGSPGSCVNLVTAFVAGAVVLSRQDVIAADRAAGRLHADRRGHGRQRRHAGARGDGARPRPGRHPARRGLRAVVAKEMTGRADQRPGDRHGHRLHRGAPAGPRGQARASWCSSR